MRHASINVLPCCLEGCGVLRGMVIILEGGGRERRGEEKEGEREGKKERER